MCRPIPAVEPRSDCGASFLLRQQNKYHYHSRVSLRFTIQSFTIMSRAHCLSLLVTMIVVLLLLMSLEVQAQDDAATCQSIKSQEAATIIRADIKLMNSAPHQPTCTNDTARDVKQIKEDLSEVKNRLGSCPQSAGNNETARDVRLIKEELAEVKNLLGSCQQPSKCSVNDSPSLCEYFLIKHIRFSCVCSDRQMKDL